MIQFVVVVGVLVLMVINTVIIRTIDFADFLDNRIHPPTNGTTTADPSSMLNVISSLDCCCERDDTSRLIDTWYEYDATKERRYFHGCRCQ